MLFAARPKSSMTSRIAGEALAKGPAAIGAAAA